MSMDGYNHMGTDPWASERAVYTKKIQSLEKKIEKLCEDLSECVSDEIDPSVNVSWMRCSPDLPKYVRRLEAELETLRSIHC